MNIYSDFIDKIKSFPSVKVIEFDFNYVVSFDQLNEKTDKNYQFFPSPMEPNHELH